MQLTKQGVRDLNSSDGKGYNGRSEGHRHNPASPSIVEYEDRVVVHGDQERIERIEKVKVRYCAFCLTELSTSLD